jgi:hypothetical protein
MTYPFMVRYLTMNGTPNSYGSYNPFTLRHRRLNGTFYDAVNLVIGVIHCPALLMSFHVALVFGSPLHIEGFGFPRVLRSVSFFIGNVKACQKEEARKGFDARASAADDKPGLDGGDVQAR